MNINAKHNEIDWTLMNTFGKMLKYVDQLLKTNGKNAEIGLTVA